MISLLYANITYITYYEKFVIWAALNWLFIIPLWPNIIDAGFSYLFNVNMYILVEVHEDKQAVQRHSVREGFVLTVFSNSFWYYFLALYVNWTRNRLLKLTWNVECENLDEYFLLLYKICSHTLNFEWVSKLLMILITLWINHLEKYQLALRF